MRPLIAILILGSMTPYFAEARRDQRREGRQQARIHQGVKSGELTRGEAAGLRAGQRRVDRAQRRAAADGNVTAEERAKLERMQDHQSKRIYEQKHDDEKRSDANLDQ